MPRNTLIVGFGLLVSLLSVAWPAPPADAAGQAVSYRNGEVIVRLKPAINPNVFANAVGLRLNGASNNRIEGRPIYRFEVIDGTNPTAKAAVLLGNAAVIYAEPNYIGQVPEAVRRSSWVVGSDAGTYAAQWAAGRINLPAAHAISRGADTIVAVLDTGVDMAHPALASRLVSGYDFVDNDELPQEEGNAELSDIFGHGTHVAGLVALTAPDARIMPLRTLDVYGTGDLWTQVVALRYAADHGAGVVNLSFSFGDRSQLFDDVVAEISCSSIGYANCRKRLLPGVVVVAAAGNSGARSREWPGASTVPGIVGVAASTEQDTLAAFSTYGGQIAVAAPGEYITSTVPGDAYATWSGTSMAAPFVSGVAALMRSSRPTLRPLDLIQRLIACEDVISGPVRKRLNAAAALGPAC